MSKEQVRLGIVGLGAQGSTYARFLTQGRVPNMVLGAISTRDPARQALAAEIAPGTPVYSDYRELFASGEVDAVIACVPHYFHPPITIAALQAGLHVMAEKPAGVYSAQVEDMLQAAEAHPDQRFAVMFNQRANPLYQEIKRLIDEDEIGAIRSFSWLITNWWRPQGYFDLSDWRATWGGEGGGVLVNQAPHQIDLLQ